jgi:hypothetical protein
MSTTPALQTLPARKGDFLRGNAMQTMDPHAEPSTSCNRPRRCYDFSRTLPRASGQCQQLLFLSFFRKPFHLHAIIKSSVHAFAAVHGFTLYHLSVSSSDPSSDPSSATWPQG